MANFADLWESGAVADVKSGFMSRLNAAKDAYLTETGKPLPITSGYRTTEEQAKLFANRGSNPNLVAPPGTSKHELGNAADISPTVPSSFLDRFGLHRPHGSKDPVHVEANPSFQGLTAQSNAPSSNFADLWESTPQVKTEQTKTDQPKSLREASARARQDLEPIAGVGEAAISAVYNPLVSLAGTVKGIVQSIPEAISQGKPPEPIGREIQKQFVEKYGFEPKTETGKTILSAIAKVPEAITGSSMGLPPAIAPEFMAAGRQLAKPGITAKLNQQFKNRFPKIEENANVGANIAVSQPTLAGVGAARSELNPYSSFTGQEIARGEAPQIKFAKMAGDVSPTEKQTRAQIITEINPTGRPRTGLITGNENTIRNEYTLANSSERSPAADILKQEIANEQKALPEYARKIVDNTGADQLLRSDYERGQRLNDAFASKEGATGFFKTEENSIYTAAREAVGDKPVATTHVDKLIASPQFKAGAGLKGTEGVLSSAESLIKLAKEVGFEDEFGNVFSASSVGSMDAVKKALNKGWTPDNASMIRKINKSIDQDIATVGGADLLKKADAIHEAQKVIFSSKGIKTLFGEVDPNGVQKATDFSAIPQKLNSLPDDQWKHIYDTADKLAKNEYIVKGYKLEIPEELQLAAKNAKAEMKGNIAREIYKAGAAQAGEWDSNAVNKTFNARMEKIKYSFDPEEIRQLYTLNAGGYLMPAKNPYEGGGLQLQRVAKLSEKLPLAGKTVGALTTMPGAEAAGRFLGEKGSMFFKGRTLRKEGEALEKELEKNKQLGTKLSDMIGK
jgi:hypothetical protein